MECRLVDGKTVQKVKERAVRFRTHVLTYAIGTLIKQTMEELGLWEDEPPEKGDEQNDT